MKYYSIVKTKYTQLVNDDNDDIKLYPYTLINIYGEYLYRTQLVYYVFHTSLQMLEEIVRRYQGKIIYNKSTNYYGLIFKNINVIHDFVDNINARIFLHDLATI